MAGKNEQKKQAKISEKKYITRRREKETGTPREKWRAHLDVLVAGREKYGEYIVGVQTNKQADDYAVLLAGKPNKNRPEFILATLDGYKLIRPQLTANTESDSKKKPTGTRKDLKFHYEPHPGKIENEITKIINAVSNGKEKFGYRGRFYFKDGKLTFWEKQKKGIRLEMHTIKENNYPTMVIKALENSRQRGLELKEKQQKKIREAERIRKKIENNQLLKAA